MVSNVSGLRAVVLVIGDQPLLRMGAVDLVEDAGFEVAEASTVDEAMRILMGRTDIVLVFADIDLMNGQDGLKLAHAIREGWPPVELILVSDKARPDPGKLPARGVFFQKPYRAEEVTAVIHQLVA